jgi:hypothetical protein
MQDPVANQYPPAASPPPVAPLGYYASPEAWQFARDASHLNTLAVLHYVWGGLILLFSPLGLLYVGIGIALLFSKNEAAFVGILMSLLGLVMTAMIVAMGVLNILSGRGMRQRRRQVLSIVMAALNCMSFPLGTALGVFTLIVVLRPSVKAMYDANKPTTPFPTGIPV